MTEANTIDPTTAKRFVGEIERCLEELLSERGSYMLRCKSIRERMNDWKTQANEAGIPRRALSVELKRRDLERKLEAVTEDLDEEIVDLADQIRDALGSFGDLPLGQAAVDAAQAKSAKGGRAKKDAAPRKERAKKAEGDAPDSDGAALDSLIDDIQETDVRPRHIREAEAARIAENAAAIESGIKPLAH